MINLVRIRSQVSNQ